MSATSLTSADLRFFAERLEASAGVRLSEGLRFGFERRLRGRLEALSLPDFGAYRRYVEAHPDELSRALDAGLVHETSFLREPAPLRAFLETLAGLPGPLRLWSAGTATGEEAFTLAMLALDAGLEVEVWGTDLSAACIERARAGRYEGASLRGAPEAWRERYFEGAQVCPAVRERLHFRVVNLLDAVAVERLPSMDGIVCRHVLVYLERGRRERVVSHLASKLLPHAPLLLGVAESLRGLATPLAPVEEGTAVTYRKREC